MMQFRYYTLSQYHQEEQWLESMAQKGWRIKKAFVPGLYFFDKAEPVKMLYRFDFFAGHAQRSDAIALYEEYGWKAVFIMNGFVLFAHPDDGQADQEIFSTEEDRKGMIRRIIKGRMVPVTILSDLSLMLMVYQFTFRRMPQDFGDGIVIGLNAAVFILMVFCWTGLLKDWHSVSK